MARFLKKSKEEIGISPDELIFRGEKKIDDVLLRVIDYDAGMDYFIRFANTVRTITPGKIKELFNTYFNTEDAFEVIAGAK